MFSVFKVKPRKHNADRRFVHALGGIAILSVVQFIKTPESITFAL